MASLTSEMKIVFSSPFLHGLGEKGKARHGMAKAMKGKFLSLTTREKASWESIETDIEKFVLLYHLRGGYDDGK